MSISITADVQRDSLLFELPDHGGIAHTTALASMAEMVQDRFIAGLFAELQLPKASPDTDLRILSGVIHREF